MNTREQQLKERQKIKKQQKKEKEMIVEKYISEIKNAIEEGYFEMMRQLDDFNQELMNSSLEYSTLQNKIVQAMKEGAEQDILEEISDKVIEMEKKNDEIYHTIISRDIHNNKLLSQLPIMADETSQIIKKAHDNLIFNKNRTYIVSMVTNRSFSLFKHYNSVIIDIALESNEYIDAYIDARENFLDFIKECQEQIEQIEQIALEEEIKSIEETVKYKQRLRVEYSDFEKFLKYKGYVCNRQGNTTHAIWKNPTTGKSMPLPNKSGTIPQGTTSKILKQMGSNRQELAEFLYA